MNISLVLPEIQCSTGNDKNQPVTVQKSSGGGKKEPLAFKKKLEDSISEEETPYGAAAAAVKQNQDSKDNSMAASLTDEKTQIVGILEGFGMLDYLSDLPLSASQNSGNTDGTDAAQKLLALLQKLTQQAEQKGALQAGGLEKYARMLSKDQLTKLPEDMQQAIVKAVEDYLGSFESTNNEPAQTAIQTAAVPPATGEASETADNIADKIAALLIRLQTERKDSGPADTVIEPVQTGKAASSVQTEKPQEAPTETKIADTKTPPVPSQTDSRPAADKPAADEQTAAVQQPKPETQTAASAVQRADANGIQTVSSQQTEKGAAQPAAKTPQTAGSNFAEDNVMRIVDKMSSQVSDGKYDFDVDLKPDFPGKVSIRLSMQNGEIRMQIKTDDLSVKSMFADQVSSMQMALKDKGFSVTHIDVTYQSQMQAGAEQKSYSQNGNGRKQNGRSLPASDMMTGIGAFETVSAINGYIQSGSSVEYLA